MSAAAHRGFTLIELLVAAAISVILLLLAMPAFTGWVADSEIRNGTESIATGIRYAQATAISQNRNAQFVLAGGGWNVAMVDAPLVPLQSATFGEGSQHVTFTAIDATANPATTVAFSPLGQVIPNGTNLVRVDVTDPAVAGSRSLRILVGFLPVSGVFNGVKICDPKFAWPDPKGCPT